MTHVFEGTLKTPSGPGTKFVAEVGGQQFRGSTSRSVKARALRYLRQELQTKDCCIAWTAVLPDELASDVAAYHELPRPTSKADRAALKAVREELASRLIQGCRLPQPDAARVLRVSYPYLQKLCS